MTSLPATSPPDDGSSDVLRNLLVGLLAWQQRLISREQLLAGLEQWMQAKRPALEEIFVSKQWLSAEQRDLLRGLLAEHLRQHDQSITQSLQALSSIGSLTQELRKLLPSELMESIGLKADLPGPSDPQATLDLPKDASGGGKGAVGGSRLRYRIVRSHARGGLGEVFIAFDSELNREVAVKEIQKRFADHDDSRSRFRLEAEITGKLEHPGIVPVYGLGQYQDGRPYYAMRFIRGDSLQQAIELFHQRFASGKQAQDTAAEESLELRKLLRRFIDVCNAMEYAHSRGVLHRDLKPGNIILGKYGETLVVDWGLAKVKGQVEGSSASSDLIRLSDDSGSSPTMVGVAVGTPAFMSPEQAVGAVDQLGPATDIYSLGATLYHLLAGRPPFKEKTVAETIAKVKEGSFESPRKYRPEIPKGLEAICLKAMALRPEGRYASPMDLSEDIERWLGDEPIQAQQESLAEKGARLIRKNRAWALSGVAALFVVAVVASIAAIWVDGARRTAVGAQLEESIQRGKAVAAEKLEREQRKKADEAAAEEAIQRKLADERTAEVQRSNYIANIRLANAAWQAGDVRAMEEALEECVPQPGSKDLRGWEWNYFQQLPRASVMTYKAKHLTGFAVSISYDGRRLAVGTQLGAEILDTVSGKVVKTLVSHETNGFSKVAISPDGFKVATQMSRGPLRIWDIDSGKLIREIDLESQQVSQMVFGPDNQTLAVGGFDHVINVWDTAPGERKWQLNGHEGIIRGLAFSGDGSKLASGDDANSAKVWDLVEGRELHSFRSSGPNFVAGTRATFFGVCFSPDGKRLATGCSNRWIEVFDITSPRSITAWTGHSDQITGLAYIPKRFGDHLVTCSLDQMLCVWSERDGTLQRTLRGHPAGIYGLSASVDGRRVGSCGLDKTMKVWDPATEVDAFEYPELPNIINAMDVSANGERVAAAGNGTYLAVLNMDSRAIERVLRPKHIWGILYNLQFSKDSSRVLSQGTEHPPSVWEVGSGKLLRRIPEVDYLGGSALSPDGTLVSAQTVKGAAIFQVADGTLAKPLEEKGFIARMKFSPDGQTLVGILEEGVGFWEVATGKCKKVVPHPDKDFTTLAVHFETGRMACAYASGMIYLLGIDSGDVLASSSAHLKTIMSLSFSPDGSRLVSGSRDQLIRVWEVPSGQLLCTLRGHKADVTQVQFAPDGNQIVSVGWDHTMRFWNGEKEETKDARQAEEVGCLAIRFWQGRVKTVDELSGMIERDPLLSEGSRAFAMRMIRERQSQTIIWDPDAR